MKKVLLGLSGGVDSSVSALLLQQEGFEVIGVTFKFIDMDTSDAEKIAKRLNIKHYIFDYKEEFKEKIINKFLDDYKIGLTPNPCILCNKEMKLKLLYEKMNELNCDYISTGHYVKLDSNGLYLSKDLSKDQTYFLSQVNKEILSKLICPLENLTKEEVREIARVNNLETANKKDSTDVCFIKNTFEDFIKENINLKEGNIIDINTNEVVGTHKGLELYTIGQRKGLNINTINEKAFVVKKDIKHNILYVSFGDDNKSLYSTSCIINNINMFIDEEINNCKAKFRYRQDFIDVKVKKVDDDTLEIIYKQGVKSVTPGQYCVLYKDDMCIGGGVIKDVIRERNKDMKKPLVLCILDGCGYREESDGNAFKNANKPTYDKLYNEFPHCLLEASGPSVGLPVGQMGTSEVGHMNLGSGRVALQPLEAINKAIERKKLYNNKLLELINHVKENNSNLHIFGLLSDGGVHSHIKHLFAILNICKENNLENVYIDVCLDGRDTEEKSALEYLDMLNEHIKKIGIGKISTISGRYYAMDRDNNFDRLKLAYDAICYGEGKHYIDYNALIDENYNNGVYDEFIIPGIINECPLNDNDGVFAFNFRKDRLREMFTLLSNPEEYRKQAEEKDIKVKVFNNLKTLTMFPVTETVLSDHVFDDLDLKNILVDYFHEHNISQLRIAETEKYPHVTFFFDGGREVEYPDMKKILIPSPKVATYDLKPEMSVYEVTDSFLKEVGNYDVTIMNLANGDMVGHTGIYEAAKSAVEHMDKCLTKIYDKVNELKGTLIIIADHGNCDQMWYENHEPCTTHTTNPVSCIITKKGLNLHDGKLADIAPTMLSLMKMPIPKEMTGKSLITEEVI